MKNVIGILYAVGSPASPMMRSPRVHDQFLLKHVHLPRRTDEQVSQLNHCARFAALTSKIWKAHAAGWTAVRPPGISGSKKIVRYPKPPGTRLDVDEKPLSARTSLEPS